MGTESDHAVRRRELAARVVDTLGLPASITGGPVGLDKYRLQSDPAVLRALAAALADLLPPDVQVLAGIEVGGVPLATALSLHTGLPWVLVRRSGDAGGGSGPSGGSVDGRVTVVVKDMARTGAAIARAAGTLRRGGALVTRAAVAVSWNPDLPGVLAPLGVTPVAALDLADLRASWRTRNVPAAP